MVNDIQNIQLDALLVYVSVISNAWQLPRQPQLGLYYVAQHAVDAGYQVRVENLSANDYVAKRLSRLVETHGCRLLGLYIDQDNLWDLRRILPALRNQQSHLHIVVGGPQVTTSHEQTLNLLPEALCGVVGEGEETFKELLSLPSFDLQFLQHCKGLAIRKETGIELTPLREPIEPLDRISDPRFLELTLDKQESTPLIMITGRGCHGRCAFCYEGRSIKGHKRLRLHSVERCIAQFNSLANQADHQYISIVDDSFVADHRRLREFCKVITARWKDQVKWFCEARVDTLVRHPDLIPIMIEAGLIRLQIGGESGNQHILDIYRKGTTLEQMRTVVCAAKQNGLLSLFANFIIGGAFETQKTYEQTRDFALELLRLAPGCMEVGHSFFTPYPGTPMYENPEAFGIKIMDREVVTGLGDHHVYCRTEQLSLTEILALGDDFERKTKQLMRTLWFDLPSDVVRRHFQANSDLGLSTGWYDLICQNLGTLNYFTSITKTSAKTFAEASEQNFENVYPIRCIDLVASRANNFLIRDFRGVVRELDTLDSMILSLSAGKLSFDDIVDIVREYMASPDENKIRKVLKQRYSLFDKEFLVVWKTNVM